MTDLQNNGSRSLYSFEGLYDVADVRNEVFSVGVWFPSTRIYKRDIFKKLRFPVGVFYEDLMTISQIYLQDLSVFFINRPLIGYRFNPKSTTALHTESHAKDMLNFYKSLAVLDDSVAVDILKIKTARGIAYFYNELMLSDFPINKVLADLKKIKRRSVLLKNLKFPDLFFFMMTSVYMGIDKIRLASLKKKSGRSFS